MFKNIRQDIKCVFDRDPAARNTFEVLTTYPGLHALIHYRLSHWCWEHGLLYVARVISFFSRWFTGIEIHPGAKIGSGFFIDHGMGVVIGETAEIGDNVTLYHGVTLGGTSWDKGKRHPTLRDGVVIGAGAKVLGPIEIGENGRVGSNAVVTKPVPAGATAVGIPGRIITKKASDEVNRKRQAMADKIGFDAYGMTDEMPDPIARSIHNMLDHMHAVDDKMERMSNALASMGHTECTGVLPELQNDLDDELTEQADKKVTQSNS